MKGLYQVALAVSVLLALSFVAVAELGVSLEAVEARLKALGYLDERTDDVSDARTLSALKAFKGAAYLPWDEAADEATLARLFADDAPVWREFDHELLGEYVEDYYYDSEAKHWVWESSANYLDDTSWPRDIAIGEPYGAMGIYATGNRRGRLNRISWKFLCFTEEAFTPDRLSVTLPGGRTLEAAIGKANLSANEFTEQYGVCTAVNCELDEEGIGLLCRIARLPDDALEGVSIALDGGEPSIPFDLLEHNVSYDAFIDDLRLFIRAWGEAGGFNAPMAKPGKTAITFAEAR